MNNYLLSKAQNNIVTAKPEEQKQGNEYAASLVNSLFKSLQAAYPGWRAAFKDDEALRLAKLTWVKAFMENGINTPEQIQLGMTKARRDESDFFPSVGKFMKWCNPTPKDIGLPSAEEAYKEAAYKHKSPSKKPWSHPAVYQAGKDTGWFFLGTSSEKESFPKFKRAYASICERVMNGETFSLPKANSTMLEYHHNGKRVDTEQNKKAASDALSELKGLLR
jgi:hypothetical protein